MVAAAAIVLVAPVGRTTSCPRRAAVVPSLVQTLAGGSSRFTVDDAVIDAGSDTSVKVQQEPAVG